MKVKVIGIGGKYSGTYQGYDYTKVNLYVDYEEAPKNGTGTRVEVLKCPFDCVPAGLKVGDKVDVQYNQYGRIDSIIIAK